MGCPRLTFKINLVGLAVGNGCWGSKVGLCAFGADMARINAQFFVESDTETRHLNSINIQHIANSIRTHGIGIVSPHAIWSLHVMYTHDTPALD